MTGNTPDGGPQVPPGGRDTPLAGGQRQHRHRVPAPYSPMRGLTPPWAFRGSASPTTRILQGAAPPGGPHGRLGRGSRSPTPPYPPWRPARPHTGLAGSGGQAPSRWLPLRKGKRSRTTTGYPNSRRQTPASEYVRAALAAGSGGGPPTGKTPRWGHPTAASSVAPTPPRKHPSGSVRPGPAVRRSPVTRISPGESSADPSPPPTWRVSRGHTPGRLPSGGRRLPPCGTPLPPFTEGPPKLG
ncbi:proline-rich protein 2-like [Camponotus floridanus]|uniref:proline-rich protein 2-like n=1 Tax=Camponotus floridanus TaxID=104421 RepID=UPI000DC6BD29|nr:proline-rich protein 2-like [Camponotus floridanus]